MANNKAQQRKKAKGQEKRKIRSILLILDLKDDTLKDSGKEGEGTTPHRLQFLVINYDQ